jgi:hypothetical protein
VTVRGNPALPPKAGLLDQDGVALTDADLSASPVVQVDYHSGIDGRAEDVTGEALRAGLAAATRSCSPRNGGSNSRSAIRPRRAPT